MSKYPSIIPRETVRNILIKANETRYSKEIQAEFNKVNHANWFGFVIDKMHRQILTDFGYGDRLEQALDELYSSRWRYRKDEDMNTFFRTLIHVKMDLTADGPIKPGDWAVDTKLITLDNEETTFSSYVQKADTMRKPLVVFAGSWT